MADQLIPLYQLAHARTGDKGNRSNISVIAFRSEDFPLLLREVTEERVREHFSYRSPGLIQRFVLPQIFAMNFVIDDVLDGGVNLSLNLDAHGKSLSYYLLGMKICIRDK
jgi:hypothetical protein